MQNLLKPDIGCKVYRLVKGEFSDSVKRAVLFLSGTLEGTNYF